MNEATASVNNTAIEEKIKSWLRQARDRDGGRKRRYELSVLRRSLVGDNVHTSNEHGSDVEGEQRGPILPSSNEGQPRSTETLSLHTEWHHLNL